MPRLIPLWRRLRRVALSHRRGIAALLAGVAVLLLVKSLAAPAAPTQELLVAAHDLPSGTVLTADDLTVIPFAVGSVPPGAVSPDVLPVGRVLAAPLGAREVLTHVRLVGGDLLDGYPGRSIIPVRISDPSTLPLLSVGTRIDLLGADPATGLVRTLAVGAQVVAIPVSGSSLPGGGGLLLVAVAPDEEQQLAWASVSASVSWVLSPPSSDG